MIAEFDLGLLANVTRYPIGCNASSTSWSRILADMLARTAGFTIHYGAKSKTVLQQDASGVTVIDDRKGGSS